MDPSTINHGWWYLYWLLTLQWVAWVIRKFSVTSVPILLKQDINHFSLMNFSYLQSILPNFPQRMQGNHFFFAIKKNNFSACSDVMQGGWWWRSSDWEWPEDPRWVTARSLERSGQIPSAPFWGCLHYFFSNLMLEATLMVDCLTLFH